MSLFEILSKKTKPKETIEIPNPETAEELTAYLENPRVSAEDCSNAPVIFLMRAAAPEIDKAYPALDTIFGSIEYKIFNEPMNLFDAAILLNIRNCSGTAHYHRKSNGSINNPFEDRTAEKLDGEREAQLKQTLDAFGRIYAILKNRGTENKLVADFVVSFLMYPEYRDTIDAIDSWKCYDMVQHQLPHSQERESEMRFFRDNLLHKLRSPYLPSNDRIALAIGIQRKLDKIP